MAGDAPLRGGASLIKVTPGYPVRREIRVGRSSRESDRAGRAGYRVEYQTSRSQWFRRRMWALRASRG
jgi:hypothetical protein